ncbi:MAG: DNA mismatch repair protein MutS [Chloroflexi bacterium]|nr:DNA mismatch repair protein MutS [Chloroflexota bacterium]MCL5026626.1 DNA mismatch repair protein MutS [Chloroflexota bacterium]
MDAVRSHITPIRRQYLQLKRRYPDAILFFRLGDFYETFDEDARVVASELEITLTGREMGHGQRVPMAGVPYHAVEGYLARLIGRGHKVAICEQLGDPAQTKGIVERDVVRVVTPGTVIEPNMLQAKSNNYLASVVVEPQGAGIAYADISTGEFAVTQLRGADALSQLQQEVARLSPAECLVPASEDDRSLLGTPITEYETWHFNLDTATQALTEHFEVQSLDGYGCASLPLAIRAAGALIQYLGDTQASALAQLQGLHTYSIDTFMSLDPSTRRNLELDQSVRGGVRGSLLWVLDQTRTPMGGRLLRSWVNQPLLELAPLEERQDQVASLIEDSLLRSRLGAVLGKIGDLERLVGRISQRMASPRDLVALRMSLERVLDLQEALGASDCTHPAAVAAPLGPLAGQLDACPEVRALIAQALVADPPATIADGGVIAPGFSEELDKLKADSTEAREWVAGLERVERERTGIRSLKVGYNKVFGYYIEVSHANGSLVPQEYIRKQTLVGAERYITPELKEREAKILSAQERMADIEQALFQEICQQVAAAGHRITPTARAIARLDALLSLAEVALHNRYTQPKLDLGEEIHITGGRHPVVEMALEEPFVPNDIHLTNRDTEIMVLTGPNMAGKSTYLRQAAILVLMAQIGSFIPAQSATIGLVDRIFSRVGAQDDIAAGQSTFMVEMAETANILHHATRRSLVILDEIGRGTSTYDGISIARAVVEYIHNHPRLGCKTIFATHYHELAELEQCLPRVKSFRVDVLEEGDRVVFLRRVVPGGADRSYGIYVARLAGVPRPVTQRAEEILGELEHAARWQRVPPPAAQQLQLFSPSNPVVDELAGLEVLSMTPLEALNKLFELQRQALNGRKSE